MLAQFSRASRERADLHILPRFDEDIARIATETGQQLDEKWGGARKEIRAELLLLERLHIWPHYFTVACLLLFSGPVIGGMHLALDRSVQYWIGEWGYLASLIPWYLVMCHWMHVKRGRPKMIPLILSTVVPGVFLLFLANIHLHYTGIVADMLRAKDCTTFSEKQAVHRSWSAAAIIYETCVNRTALVADVSREEAFRQLRLPDCGEYAETSPDPYAEFRKSWEYLRRMEEESMCSGWCWEARPLWTFAVTKDSCSSVAGTVLAKKVRPICYRMLTTAFFSALLAVLAISLAAHYMRLEGKEWKRW